MSIKFGQQNDLGRLISHCWYEDLISQLVSDYKIYMLKTVLVDYNPVALLLNKLVEKVGLVADISDHVKDLLFNKYDNALQKFLFLLGVATLTYKTGHFLNKTIRSWAWVPHHIASNRKINGHNLKKIYGDCYVCITGFTEGIGRGYAQVFAEFGFNLLLIGRNKEKVELKVMELKRAYHHIKIQYFVSQLADLKQIDRLQDNFKALAGLDIGIVVNNAGSVAGGPYLSIKPESLVDDINVDLCAVFVINRILIPRLRERDHRSAIINIASCTGYFLSTRVGVYSSTKKSLDVYSRILDMENQDKIDVVSVRPFGVTTKMMRMKKGPFMISPRECALATLADMLAGKNVTFGHFKHKLSSLAFEYLNEKQRFELYEFLWAEARRQTE